jgi:preprotein translocase subunit SecA
MSVAVSKMLTRIFGSRNERLLKRYRRIVDQVNQAEPRIQAMSDDQLRARTNELRTGLRAKKLRSEEVMPEVFAIIRESMDRHIGIREIFNPEQSFDPDQFDDTMLQAYDAVQQKMISTGESWQKVAIPTEIYAAVRKLYPDSRPPFRARPFDVQLIGGMVLYDGRIAEMATGEGKTFVAPIACFLRVLEGMHCHVVTVNDYLVRRDASWVRPAFENLGISVGYIQSEFEPGGDKRRSQYDCDITYGTNSEFGFDYLRDNMKVSAAEQVQGPLDFAIVDEVDSILIDEARTPLIISGAAHDDAPKYKRADEVARRVIELAKPWMAVEKEVDAAKRAIKAAEGDEDKAKSKEEKEKARQRGAEAQKRLEEAEKKKEGLTQYFEVELDRKSVKLTHEGFAAAQEVAGVGSFFVGNNMEWPHLMEQAMRAHVVYERDKDYVVERGQRTGEMEVVIVDEYTGRKMVGRQWSDGLHQAIEAKERVPIKQETQTLATITLQNFFKLYKQLAGMTGTAQTEAEEFAKIYRLEVVTIPTNRPIARVDHEDRVYRKEPEKWHAIIEEIKEFSDKGRPVLVGTTSVEKSEMISTLLGRKYGIQHEVLNAKQHEREAHIVALAGQQHKNPHGEPVGNVTIATNMAGRGTDIKLSPESHKAGGLHVIGTERHTARRIDNQLRGRGGRQGDPGSSRFYVSLEDDLMKMFAGEWTIKVLGWLGMEEGMEIEHPSITKGIIRAQKKVEERNYLARKNLLEYDEVMDHQRTAFYGMRQRVLEGAEVDTVIWEMIGDAIRDAVDKYVTQDYVAANVAEWARTNFEVAIEVDDLRGMRRIEDLEEFIKGQARVEAEGNIGSTLGEFMGEDITDDTSEWDTKGLSSWAMSRFHVNLPQSQIRRMTAAEVEQRLKEAALEQIDARHVDGLVRFLEPMFAETELAEWAKSKFSIEIDPAEFLEGSGKDARGRTARKSAEAIVELIDKRARAAYARREVEYPVDHILTLVTGGDEAGIENPYALDHLRGWVRAKYGRDLSLDHLRSQSYRKLREELIGYQEEFMRGTALERDVDAIVRERGTADAQALAIGFGERFGIRLSAPELQSELDGSPDGSVPKADAREALLLRARRLLRQELTDLEQFVLIQIFDQSWKDHLYAMDMLKGGIGLSAFAEKDPRVLYKKEGFRYFEEMLAGIRDKATDLIFRARVVGQAQAKSAYRETAAVHEDAGGYGVGENVLATADAVAPAGGGEEGRASRGGEEGGGDAPVRTIVREAPRVGRNDPCPCGSGKKYKKCHGADVA